MQNGALAGTMKKVTLYTDGACRGNPGRGGYAAILVYGKHEKEISGGEPETTNNRMELLGVIRGLSALKEPCEVDIYSDSKYVVDAFLSGWVEDWRARNFRRGTRDEVKNSDLWETLLSLTETHIVRFHWVKGHAGHPYNERCDALATAFADSFTGNNTETETGI